MKSIRDKTLLLCLGVALALTRPGAGAAEGETPPTPPPSNAPVLRQILIADSVEGAQALEPVPDGGFVVLSPALSFLDGEELTRRLVDGKDRVVDDRLL